jgi:CspA family cold shock protein
LATGTVKWFNDQKGYGFITQDTGGDVFVHYSGIEGSGFRALSEGDRVQFEVVPGAKGPQATSVRKLTTPVVAS